MSERGTESTGLTSPTRALGIARGLALGLNTIKRAEFAEDETSLTARRALEAAGVMFIDKNGGAGPGVRLRNAETLPGVTMNDLTDASVVEGLSGNAVLNGVPVTLDPLEVARP